MTPYTAPTSTLTAGMGLRYGLLGLPLAFVALPLYVHLPNMYATRYGIPLATLGMVLLLARIFDGVTDPWLGRFGDRLFKRSSHHVIGAGVVAALLLVLSMGLLFFPPWANPGNPLVLMVMLMLTSLAFSLLAIAHQAWGARLGGDEVQRARIVAWREGAGLVGVVLASVLPSLLGWGEWIGVFALALAAGLWAWHRSPPPLASAMKHSHPLREDLLHPWRHAPFRRLMAVFVVSGMASAVPATLVLFFIQDRLNAPAQEPLFLATYFVAAALSMPLWMRAVARWGLAHSWLMGMLLSVAVFLWAATLSTGDVIGFWWVCALSGLALGSDLALPGALLAGLIADRGDRGQREGAYFGWWNLASKLNLALAAGLALPLLDLLGYRPGTSTPAGLQALTLAYAVLPCSLKLLAAVGLYLAFIRAPSSSRSTLAEVP
jgi:glycoside/pentoside/hexuronide:cation symporter, GPH family